MSTNFVWERLSPALKLTAISPLVWRCAIIGYGVILILRSQGVFEGQLLDNDDYMRLQQVRDFLHGQAWVDVDQHRFASPEGGAMHFSRLPDVLMAALTLLARPFVGPANAETFMLLAYPGILFLGFLATSNLSMRTIQPSAAFPHMMILLIMTPVLVQFLPGRIDHHSMQLFFAMIVFLCALRAQDAPRWAGICGAALVAMLAIGMETAPFVIAAAVAVSLPWVFDGKARGMVLFGAALIVASPAMLVLVNAGGPMLTPACDAYSSVQGLAAMLIGAVALALAGLTRWLRGFVLRLAAACVLGAAAGGIVIALFPQCLAGPFGAIDAPLLVEWRSGLRASRNMFELLQVKPAEFVLFYGPVAVGVACVSWLTWRSQGLDQRRWLVVLIFVGISSVVAMWLLRGTTAASAFAALPAAAIIANAWRNVDRAEPRTFLKFALFVGLISPFSSMMASSLIMGQTKTATEQEREAARKNCNSNVRNFAKLDDYPAGIVLTQIDIGPEVLVFSHHKITSAPYHRNRGGIMTGLKVFSSSPDKAVKTVRETGAEYLMFCSTSGESSLVQKGHPGSLTDVLKKGEPPDWLERLDTGDSDFEFYRILPDRDGGN